MWSGAPILVVWTEVSTHLATRWGALSVLVLVGWRAPVRRTLIVFKNMERVQVLVHV